MGKSTCQKMPGTDHNAKGPLPEGQQKNHRSHGSTRKGSHESNPCAGAYKVSLKCLDRNDYDRSKCQDYFEVYKECMAEWQKAKRARRRWTSCRVSVRCSVNACRRRDRCLQLRAQSTQLRRRG